MTVEVLHCRLIHLSVVDAWTKDDAASAMMIEGLPQLE